MISSTTNTPPTFSSILSGLYPVHHGVRTLRDTAVREEVTLLPQFLKSAGYHTHALVTGPLVEAFGLNKGFDTYHHRGKKDNVYSLWGDRLTSFFQDLNASPWFVLLHLFEVHRPRQTHGIRARTLKDKYDIAWRELDKKMDTLLNIIPDDTIVMLTGDHGETYQRRSDRTIGGYLHRKWRDVLGRPRRPMDCKNHGYFLYDELIRIPFVMRGPGVPKGRVVDSQVRQIDIMPTILSLVGIDSDVDGQSLLPLIENVSEPPRSAFLETGDHKSLRHWQGLRKPPWKYIENISDQPVPVDRQMLFNLAKDPHEHYNVFDRHPHIVRELQSEMNRIIHQQEFNFTPNVIPQKEQEKLEILLQNLGYL